MPAGFNYAVHYDVTATCMTPLRTGSGDTESVLRDEDDTAILQGTSIAGALRAWCRKTAPRMENRLFGSQDLTGSLIFSDGIFEKDSVQATRPRLAIDGRTGTAKDGAKFDIAHIAKGSTFRFTIDWFGPQKMESELQTTEQLLSALNSGAIRFGAQKNAGFGKVSLVVCRSSFDMKNPKDRQRWITESYNGETLRLAAAVADTSVRFVVKGQMDNVLVKSGIPKIEGKKSIIQNILEGDIPVLPGSSIKGAVRARCEMIADYLLGDGQALTDSIFGRGAEAGDNGIAGTVCFEDVYLTPSAHRITRIRINRFTGGVMNQNLFMEDPICSDAEVTILAPKDDKTCALLYFALRDLGLGLYSIGSEASIGRGLLSRGSIEITAPDGKRATVTFPDNGTCKVEDSSHMIDYWLQALEVEA